MQAINIMKLSIYKTKDWHKRHAIFMVGMMQLLGAIGTEALNIFQICSTYSIKDIVMNFVQLGIIAMIDDLYAQSLRNNFFMKVLRKSEIEMKSTKKDKDRSAKCNKSSNCCFSFMLWIMHWILKGFYRLIKILYSTFYFYFAPYAVIVLSLYQLSYAYK